MKKFSFLIYFFIFGIFFVMSLPYYSGDVKNHVIWAQSILDQGIVGFYERYFHDYAFQSYPPISTGLFVVSLGLYNLLYNLIHFLNIQIPVFPITTDLFYRRL
ncbi:MAG: hypothetical protein AABY22_21360 [Nanoarchaeota archaeon]